MDLKTRKRFYYGNYAIFGGLQNEKQNNQHTLRACGCIHSVDCVVNR